VRRALRRRGIWPRDGSRPQSWCQTWFLPRALRRALSGLGFTARSLSGAPYAEAVVGGPLSTNRLQQTMRGPVLAPEHPAYEVARTTFNTMIDRAPAVIACCADSDDVAAAIAWAQQEGLPMAIRGGGHSVAGHSICSGGLLIDLRLMGGVLIDPESRRARVGGGATGRSVDACSAMHRLAMPGGNFDTTGVAGLTLGGGIGHLIGLHRLTLDNLESAEVVLADGTVVTASNTVEPELFWALRGGGGNFGAVTEFEFRLHPLPTVWGGIITYARPQVADAVRLFRDVMATAPDELTMMCYLDQTRSPRPQTTSAVGRNVLRDPQVSSNDVKVPNCGGGETLLEPRVPGVAVESHSR